MAHQNSNEPLADLTQLGQSNLTGDTRALYLKLFSGEMFKGFQNNTIARDLVMKRTLRNGKSLQFIYTGRTTSEFHTPGNSILGNSDGAPPVAEKTITIDDLLISSAFVYELDEILKFFSRLLTHNLKCSCNKIRPEITDNFLSRKLRKKQVV